MNNVITMNKNEGLLHLMIIWSKAQSYKDYILDDLQKEFRLMKVFRCQWEKEKFLDNFFVFYSHFQCHRERNDYRRILENKVNVCGDGEFTAIILRDDHPRFEERETSGGVRVVNTRVFDKKYAYRDMVGGGHRIHSSDDAWETNKDLTILFGMNTEDFCERFHLTSSLEEEQLKEEIWAHNCLGVGGYKSISELFYVLNNTIKYVVLRNHEVLPEEYTVEGHGDIDLLVENKNYAAYLTLARPVFKESYRVYHIINIAGKEVPFDFRYVQDNYYSPKWEQDILKSRVLQKGLFYVPSPEHQFYTLLYHAYIQKWEVKPDYIPKLTCYGKQIGVDYKDSPDLAVELLDAFMLPRNYEYIRPNDKSVIYNQKNLRKSKMAFRYGTCVKQLDFYEHPFGYYYTAVFENVDSFIKVGTDWLIGNEIKILKIVDDCGFSPKIIRQETLDDHLLLLEESAVDGVEASLSFKNSQHLSPRFIKSFVQSVVKILHELAKHKVIHRDFLSGNVLVRENGGECAVSLIDYGWSCVHTDMDKPCSRYLGGVDVPFEKKLDSYECSRLLRRLFPHSSYVWSICQALNAITRDDYKNDTVIVNKIEAVVRMADAPMPVKDKLYIVYRRCQLIHSANKEKVSRLVKRIRRVLHV